MLSTYLNYVTNLDTFFQQKLILKITLLKFSSTIKKVSSKTKELIVFKIACKLFTRSFHLLFDMKIPKKHEYANGTDPILVNCHRKKPE